MGEFNFGRRDELAGLTAPVKLQPSGVQGVVRQDEPGALRVGEPVFHERQIEVFVAAIYLIAHNRIAEVREVDADLVFAAGQRAEAEQGKS